MRHLECLGRIDVGPLKEAVAEHARHFDDLTFRQDAPGTPHSATQTLYLRMPATISRETIFEGLECQDWPLMAVPVFREAVEAVAGLARARPARAMIVKLRAGGRIARHRDEGGYAAATERFHLAITTNDQCVMHVGDEAANAQPGEVYFFDKSVEHEVVNGGETDRLHLILDVWKSGITYKEERFSAIRHEIAELVTEHWAEVADNLDIPADVDWEHAINADELDILRVMTVRSDGALVGYMIFLLVTLPHYKQILAAYDDAFFLKKQFRHGMVGVRMFREAEKMLAACGVNKIVFHEKTKVPIGKVFKFLGYKPTETIWTKELAPPSHVHMMVRRAKQMRPKPLRRITIVQ